MFKLKKKLFETWRRGFYTLKGALKVRLKIYFRELPKRIDKNEWILWWRKRRFHFFLTRLPTIQVNLKQHNLNVVTQRYYNNNSGSRCNVNLPQPKITVAPTFPGANQAGSDVTPAFPRLLSTLLWHRGPSWLR